MQISPVRNINFIQHNNQKNINFSGLWGATTRTVDKDPVLCVATDYVTYYYYPYMDETQSEVQRVVDDNVTAYFDKSTGKGKYVVKDCKVCTTLPFKKVNFETYMNADKSTKVNQNIKKVHYGVRGMYLNNDLENQIPAVNDTISSKLD